jgi:broad specificity phosphatase PhoE
MPPKRIYFIRHAQALHNLDPPSNFHIQDPPLTVTGERQCMRICDSLPPSISLDLLVVSPLRRAIQTLILGLPSHVRNTKILVLPLAQEIGPHPSDTGSETSAIKSFFPEEIAGKVDISALEADLWYPSKAGPYESTQHAVGLRADAVRKWLYAREEESVVFLTHGGLIRYILNEGEEGEDFHNLKPGQVWENCKVGAYKPVLDVHGEVNLIRLGERDVESGARVDETMALELAAVESN